MAKLFVRVIRAHHLPPSDLFSESDPYIEVSINGQTKKTSTLKHTLNPVWDETLLFNMKHFTLQDLYPSIISSSSIVYQQKKPIGNNIVRFSVVDWDRF